MAEGQMKRRDFLSSPGAITTALASASPSSALPASATTSPEAAARDLIIRKQQGTLALQFGYHAITWNGKDLQAIEEIAAGGFKGIQLRSNILPEYGDKPSALKEILARHHLTFVALSSGDVLIDPAREAAASSPRSAPSASAAGRSSSWTRCPIPGRRRRTAWRSAGSTSNGRSN